ncbi:hypothetical protein BJV82DRAFT_600549 [Fennellomyces sp. T-0311]|nr:hypothetical protein BJV82DRAFT_600549 [Fennellomyces sp. T-0311]
MMSSISDRQSDYVINHRFQRLHDININDESDELYGASSSRRASSSRSNSSSSGKLYGQTATGPPQPPRISIFVEQQPPYLSQGQAVSGQIFIDTNGAASTIRVVNLRASLFGSARIHGDSPDQPLLAGLFDYKKDVKIISTGIRIVRRQKTDTSLQDIEVRQHIPRKRSKDKARLTLIDHDFDVRPDEQEGVHSGGEDIDTNGCQDSSRKSPSKLARDNAIAQLMEKIALGAPSDKCSSSHGLPVQIRNGNDEEDKSYSLDYNKSHRIRFSIPINTKRSLPGTVDDPNFPIRYSIAALLMYTTDHNPNERYISYTVLPLEFQPSPVNPNSHEKYFLSGLKTNPVSVWITNSKLDQLVLSVKRREPVKTVPPPRNTTYGTIQTVSFTGCNSVPIYNTTWMGRLLNQLSHYYVQRRKVLETPYLSCSLELPQEAFAHGDTIPLRIHVENTGLDISQAIVKTQLVQTIYMTHSCGELVRETLIDQATTLFTGNDPIQLVPINDQSSIKSAAKDSGMDLDVKWEGYNDSHIERNLCSSRIIVFDLTKVLNVPDQCAYTVLPDMSKNAFEISYQLKVTLSVTGSKIVSTTQEDGYQSIFIANPDQHFSRSNAARSKGYTLKPPSVPIVIGSKHQVANILK